MKPPIQVDLQEIVKKYWGEGKRSGSAVMYRARWRSGDNTPSFAVYRDGYKDFGSGESGSPLKWVILEFGYPYAEALEWLENWNTGNSSQISTTRRLESDFYPAKPARHEPPSKAWQQHMRHAIRQTQRMLWTSVGNEALEYLRKERGLNDETIRAAGLGYSPGYYKTGYFDRNDEGKKREVRFSPGIVIPWEVDGDLYAVRIRSRVGNLAEALGIPDDRFAYGDRKGEVISKYLSVRGSRLSGILYGAQNVTPDKQVIFFEGEFDALLAGQELGDQAACVTFGSASNVPTALPDGYAERLKAHDWIYTVMDADEAGQAADIRLHRILNPLHKRLVLPQPHKDITDFVRAGGDVRAWFAKARGEQVPNSWISALLHLRDSRGKHQGSAAPVYYALIQCANAKLIDTQAFTTQGLQAAAKQIGINMDYALLNKGIRVLGDNEILVKIGSGIDFDSASNPDIKGRPADTYRLVTRADQIESLSMALRVILYQKAYPVTKQDYQSATIADLNRDAFVDVEVNENYQPPVERNSLIAKEQQYKERKYARKRDNKLYTTLIASLRDMTSTPMPEGWSLDTLRSFRIAYLRALKLGGLVGSTLDAVSLAIGISRDVVNQYVEYAGCTIERDQTVAVALHPDEPIDKQVRQTAMNVRGKPLALETIKVTASEDGASTIVVTSRVPYTVNAAYQAIEAGEQVQIRYQVANKHIPQIDAQPAKFASLPRRRRSSASLLFVQYEAGRDASMTKKKETDKPKRTYQKREFKRPGYSPKWVEGQIRLRLELLEWQSADKKTYTNPNTGETIPYESPLEELIWLLADRNIEEERALKAQKAVESASKDPPNTG